MHLGARAALLLSIAAPVAVVLAWAVSAAAQQALADARAMPSLSAGQYQWFERAEPVRVAGAESPVRIVVSLAAQRAYVYRGERLIAISTVSTGSPGYSTPTGTFSILQKKPFHRSNLYSDAPMPYMQRLTWTGIALHAGHLPGYPASHGCIRLPTKFAQRLYEITALGGIVSIVRDAPYEPALQPERAPVPVIAQSAPAPILIAEMRGLGDGAYDVLTISGDPPAAHIVAQPVPFTGTGRETVSSLLSSSR